MDNGERLRHRLSEPRILVAPGAANALTARLIQDVGFDVVYATGAGIANSSFGIPDIGLLSMSEVLAEVRRITSAVDIPVIADADTGYGGPLNVMRTVQEFEDAGVAAIQIEDQVDPKKCGHFDDKHVVPFDDMLRRLDAALSARRVDSTVIIGRTDARRVNGLEDALQRAEAMSRLGVDLLFVEAPESRAELASIAERLPGGLVANMVEGGRTPLLSADELQSLGFSVVIFANTALRLSIQSMLTGLRVLEATGTSASLIDNLVPWDERQRIVGLDTYLELDQQFSGPGPGTDAVIARVTQ